MKCLTSILEIFVNMYLLNANGTADFALKVRKKTVESITEIEHFCYVMGLLL
jgi:hypothetical protein